MAELRTELIGYRFRAVELDLVRGVLRVEGREIVATPLPMKLLALLCEREGELCTRQEIFDHVWPRQDVSDDALNKLISRLRELLETHAEAIVTVRKQGLRLDAPVERLQRKSVAEVSPAAIIERAEPVTSASTTESVLAPRLDSSALEAHLPAPARRAMRTAKPHVWAALLLIAILLVAWLMKVGVPTAPWAPKGDEIVFTSYALRESDLQASRPETADLVRAAEVALDRSDSAQARQLLQAAERSDSTSAVVPALRAIHHASDETETLDDLVHRARERLTPVDSPYTRLLIDYAAAQSVEDERSAVDALLTLRPEAWRLRLRRAHIDIQMSNREGALRSLRSIPVDKPPAQTLMYVLADRISYGDGAAVRQALDAGALKDAPFHRAYVEARFAWSAQSADVGRQMLKISNSAESAGTFVLAAHARELSAAHAYFIDDAQAQAQLNRAAFTLKATGRGEFAAPMLALSAEIAHRHGNDESARSLLQQALAASGTPQERVELEILNARLGLLPRGSFLETAGGTDDRFGRGEPALVAAWYALRAGKRHQAVAALSESRAGGVAQTTHAESAALLGLELGEAPQDCWLDPPYPDLLRLAPCRLLREASRAANKSK